MSKRLLHGGRYPKSPGVDQINNTSAQFPQVSSPYAASSEVPFYSAPPQSQAVHNAWTNPYPNPSTYQNQVPHQSVPESSNYWSDGQMYPMTIQQPQPSEPWNWKSENNAESSSYSSYQQPPIPNPADHWQQSPYSQTENQNFSQQQTIAYNSSQQEYHPTLESQPHTNNNSDSVNFNSTLQHWENGGLNITEPEQLPWTYGAPQYCNPSIQPSIDFSQNSNISPWTYNSDYTDSSGIHMQDVSLTNYLAGDNISAVQSVVESQTDLPAPEHNITCESGTNFEAVSVPTSGNVPRNNLSNNSEQSAETEYENSALSAFFQNTEPSNSANNSEHEGTSTPDVRTALDSSSLAESISHLQIHDSEKSSLVSEEEGDPDQETDDGGNLENNFIQKENLYSSDEESRRKSVSPSGYVEEPINQEVPEPHANDSVGIKTQPKQDFHEISCEEPLNQQVPTEPGQQSRSASSERERMIIRPREESPFKPPRLNNISKGTVVQKEVDIQKHEEAKLQEKTVVQEVNLETFPDNLERPPDYEELRKQSPLYVSHQKHLRNELNSSPSSLLCDNPDIPCVTLAPAAPPIHSSAKSDKSESSCDSKQELVSFENSVNFAASSKELNVTSAALIETEVNEKSKKYSQGFLTNSRQMTEMRSGMGSDKKSHIAVSNTANEASSTNENENQPQVMYLKDSKIKEIQRNESQIKQALITGQPLGPDNVHANNTKWDVDITASDRPKTDTRYSYNHLESNRQRFAEQKYPSFDERQYYSDRERSRPPSRSSLGERPEDYILRKSEDYVYPPNADRRRGPPEYGRPSSRVSETDMSRDRHGQYDYYHQQYPYSGTYPRPADYYQRPPNFRGYEYDPYQRDPYYASYYDAYRYAYSNYNYGFYDELYRNDPRYRQYREEQYRQYYAKYGYDADYERSSVHSGRSSANELAKDITSNQYTEADIDSNSSEFSAFNLQQSYSFDVPNGNSTMAVDEASTTSARLTPVKFSYAHPIARFSPSGLLITAIPTQISSALAMPVKIQSLQVIMENEESFQELKSHQGPLIRGLTHKNDVIEFCVQKIKSLKLKDDIVDRDSHILLWELMILLLRQNGSVAGSDIAELLLNDHEILRSQILPLKHAVDTPQSEQSPADVNDSSSQSHAGDASSPDEGIVVLHDKSSLNTSRTVDVDKITRKFREFLLFGHKKDALEWAMKHGLWGHALFLASKMDLRTYANVMTRFANSLALNDPLQTLYQLMSGRQPSAVTCVADKKWGDWRPHLAMILSNPSPHPDVDSRSITTLGDTLASRGCLPAAHFCYIMAQVDFGTFEQKSSKLVLISADHRTSFEEFATNEAIQCTEIYEYAQSLANPGYMLTHLQVYKFIYALRLVEHGLLEEALHYCEIIASNLQAHPTLFSADFVSEVYKLSTQLKYHDPHFLRGQGELEDQDDPEWLKNLFILIQNYNNILQGQNNTATYYEKQQESSQASNAEHMPLSSVENLSYQNVQASSVHNEVSDSINHMNYYQPNNWNQQSSAIQNTAIMSNNQQDAPMYYQGDMINSHGSFQMDSSIPSHEENETTDVPSSPVTQTPPFDYYSGGTQQVQESKQSGYDQINNFSTSSSHRERRDSTLSSGSRYSTSSLSVPNKGGSKENIKSETKKEKPNSQAGKTWLGGIFSRLLPKAPNQMILPDDKNPTIVWDDARNCWVNKDSNDDEDSNAPLAPPTDMELMGSKSSEKPSVPAGVSMPPANSPSLNKFQRPKTRIMRHNYVDVLNTSGATLKTNVPPEVLFPTTVENTSLPKMFIPSTASVIGENSSELEPGHSSFSTPHLDTEEHSVAQSTAPLMLDPAEFDSRKSSVGNQRHTIGRTGRRTYPT